MKIYTRTGDDGSTGLFGGDRVAKDHPRIQAYGTVDELNAVLGMGLAHVSGDSPLRSLLLRLQHDLLIAGSDLATPLDSRANVPRIAPEDVQRLEKCIDMHESSLPTTQELHIARGNCAGFHAS